MIEFKPSNGSNDFNVITKKGNYPAKLAVLRTSYQDEKYAKDKDNNPIEPKQLVSFVFDVLDKEGNNVHVHTKPCTISFNEKSNLPKLWEDAVEISNMKEFQEFFYDAEGNLKDICVNVNVSVEEKDGKVYNQVKRVTEITESNDVKPSELFEWDLKVYGKPCDDYDCAPSYKA